MKVSKITNLHRSVSDTILWAGIMGATYVMQVNEAMAQTVGGDITQGANDLKSGIATGLSVTSFTLGGGGVVGGIMKVVEHVRQPQQTPLKHGLIGIGGGVAMLGVGALINHAMTTMNLQGGGQVTAPTFG